MKDYPKSRCIDNVFTKEELDVIIAEIDTWPVASYYAPQKTKNKNLDYHVPGSIVNKIIKPKLGKILHDPNHEFFGGAFKEYQVTFPLHIDNLIPTASKTFDAPRKHQTAFLIPLMEHEGLKTATFDIFLPAGHHAFTNNASVQLKLKDLKPFLLQHPTDINLDEFSHITDPLKSVLPYIPIDGIFQWKYGSVITWHFDQLHCSTDFRKIVDTKKLIVVLIN